MSSISKSLLSGVTALLLAPPFAAAQPPWQQTPRQPPYPQPPSYAPPSYTPAPQAGVPRDAERMVSNWYRRYLHRRPDPSGLQSAMIQFQNGETPTGVQGGLLGSDEYFQNHGSTPEGFITGLYEDVLGRQPSPRAMSYWLDQLGQDNGNRQQMANDFLKWANRRR
jgi:hypothetical protein